MPRPSTATLQPSALLGLAALVIIWGLSIPLTKLGLDEIGPLMLTVLRFLVAVVCLLVILVGRPMPPARVLVRLAGLGFLGIGIGQVAQAVGVQHANASVATIISALIPLFVVLFAAIRLRQPIRPIHAVGFVLALVGVAIVARGGAPTSSGQGVLGEVLVLLSAVSIGLGHVLMAELTARHGPAVVAAWSSLFRTALLLPAGAWEFALDPRWPGVTGLAVVLYLGVLVSGVGLWLWLYVLPARIAAGAQYFQPLVGIGASALLFGDVLGLPFVIGSALVIGGVVLTTRPARRTGA